jgi:hypothetical protein
VREKTSLFAEHKLRNVYKVAVAYRVAPGDKEKAVAARKEYDERSIRSALVSKIDEWLNSLQSNPRFSAAGYQIHGK